MFIGDKLLDLNGVSNVDFQNESGKIVFVNISINNETTSRCFQVIKGTAAAFHSGDALFSVMFGPNFVTINNNYTTPIRLTSVAVL